MKKYSKEWWKEWFKSATIRALITFAEGVLGMSGADGLQLLNLNWGKILLASLIMAGLSYLRSLVFGMPELEENNG